MPLTIKRIEAAKPGIKPDGTDTGRPYRLADERGLYLEVAPNGSRYWRFKYRYNGREKRLALGVYPEIGLALARQRREAARRLLADGIDPSAHRKAKKASGRAAADNLFEVIAREWFSKKSTAWNEQHADRVIRRLERDVFPWIGRDAITEINAAQILATVQRIEGRGAIETAHRALQNIGQVFRYAVATARALRDPTPDLRGSLPRPAKRHFAAVTEPAPLGELLRAIHAYKGTYVVACALKLAPLVFVRPGELRAAEWASIDLASAEWRFIASKTHQAHIVPLSRQAVSILTDVQALTGDGRYVFPSARTPARPMSDNALLAAYRRLGIEKSEMTTHGFRAAARTILDEVLHFAPHLIEHQLAHAVRDPNGRAYNRTAHLPERREMMQRWADYLDELRGSNDRTAPSALSV